MGDVKASLYRIVHEIVDKHSFSRLLFDLHIHVVSLAAIHNVQYRSQRCITTPSKSKVKVQNITTRIHK